MTENEMVSLGNTDHSKENVNESISESDYDSDYLEVMMKMNPKLKEEFQELISDCNVASRKIHEKAKVTSNGDIHIFYRYFFSKYVCNLQGKVADVKGSILERHASIFPFKTNPNLPTTRLPVAELFDDTFLKNIRDFVDYHFCKTFDMEYLTNLYLSNINHFRSEHFKNSPPYRQLTRIVGLGSNEWRQDSNPESLTDYLNNFIRLNEAGIEWYKYFQTKFNEVCKRFNKNFLILPEKSKSYFQYLPEINCCELLLLLETDFHQLNCKKCTHLFKKYLFFFGHCIKGAEPNVVFFIDETLFFCLQFKKKYETFQGDIFDLQWELWMMTLVNRRKYPISKNQNIYLNVDDENLKNVVDYIQKTPGFKSASLYYSEPQHPTSKIFVLFDDVIFVLGFSSSKNTDCCFGQILKSALLSKEIRKIVYYNPCLGEETTFDLLPKKGEILNFIRKHNKLVPEYPEKFLINGLTNYFVNTPHNAYQFNFDSNL